MYYWLKICIINFIFLHSLVSLGSESTDPQILSIQGDILYRSIYDARWKSMDSNTRLSRNDIVKTSANSKLKLLIRDGVSKTHVEIATPTMIRLDSSLIREIKSKDLILPNIPKFYSNLTVNKKKTTVVDSIAGAFNNLRVMTLGAKDTRKRNDASLTDPYFKNKADESYERLVVTYPPHESVVSTQDPRNLLVIWEDRENNYEFDVFRWDFESGKKLYLGRTKANMFKLSNMKYGPQVVEIVSTDGNLRSGLIKFVVEDPAATIAKVLDNNYKSQGGGDRYPTLDDTMLEKYFSKLYPPKNFVVFDKGPNFGFMFGGRVLNSDTSILSVHVKRKGSRQYQVFDVSDLATAKFSSGAYEWKVLASFKDKKPFYSESRNIKFVSSDESEAFAEQIGSIFRNSQQSTLRISN